MKLATKISSISNIIAASILWLLAILTFAFNYWGVFTIWSLAGFGFILFLPIALLVNIVAVIITIISAIKEKNGKYVFWNLLTFIPSIISLFVTVKVSAEWFWV